MTNVTQTTAAPWRLPHPCRRKVRMMLGHTSRRAFTLVEMLVVIVIVVIVLAVSFPMIWAIERSGRISAGINTVGVAATAARAYAGRPKPLVDLGGGLSGTYSGSAIVFCPSGEIRLVENDQAAISTGNSKLELMSPGRNGYLDIPNRDYIAIPKGTGIVGITKNATGANPQLLAPPFAIRFDAHGHLLSAVGSSPDRVVYYDSNYDGRYRTSAGAGYDRSSPYGGGTYNADAWTNQWNSTANKYGLPFEEIECAVGVMVFNLYDYKDAGKALTAADLNNFAAGGGGTWILTNGRPVFFSRYTGAVIREGPGGKVISQ